MGKYGKISRKKLGLGFMFQKWDRFHDGNIKPTMYEDITGINGICFAKKLNHAKNAEHVRNKCVLKWAFGFYYVKPTTADFNIM